nr:MAG TPA: hypothetical protein [Caudoviricetes sp.]
MKNRKIQRGYTLFIRYISQLLVYQGVFAFYFSFTIPK